jgi:hypothetical protein
VFVGSWPDDLPARTRGEIAEARLEVADRQHPLMEHLTLRGARAMRAKRVELLEGTHVLARSMEGSPMIFWHQSIERSSLCVAFDVLESDLPFRNSFPVLLRNAVAFFGSDVNRWVQPAYDVGQVITPLRPLPDTVREVQVGRISGKEIIVEPTPVTGGQFHYANTNSAGPLRFEIEGGTTYACISLANEQETRLSPDSPPQPLESRLTLTGRIGRTVPWIAFAAFGALLIVAEWFTYHHRWTE